jgi:hypothetical protein
MAAGIKTISDALIAKLATASGLDSGKVKTFDGDARELVAKYKAVPFVGVKLTNVRHEAVSSDGRVAEQVLTFELLLITEVFGDAGYSIESCYGLLDTVTQKLMAETLGIDGLRPIEIKGGDKNTDLEADRITAYDYEITVKQMIQKL